jgi:hypothetical protein
VAKFDLYSPTKVYIVLRQLEFAILQIERQVDELLAGV